jgi:sugar lactone lactonase YvrE
VTVAGGNRRGNQSNQLDNPTGIHVDDDNQCIYIADCYNHRIVEWKSGAKMGQVVAGGNGQGNRTDQLNYPTNVLVDKENDSLIICDRNNRRVVRWLRRNGTKGEIIISDIYCYGVTMDNNGDLYVSDAGKNEVRRWKIGETNGSIVVGGNGGGNQLNQLNEPGYLFVDEDHSVYVSDMGNHRVMKWVKGAKEGIVVAGGQGRGHSLTQLYNPRGVTVDHLGNLYVASYISNRIMCWSKGSKEGRVIFGQNVEGLQPNQFPIPSGLSPYPNGLSFDLEGHLYVADAWNNRVQKFEIDMN